MQRLKLMVLLIVLPLLLAGMGVWEHDRVRRAQAEQANVLERLAPLTLQLQGAAQKYPDMRVKLGDETVTLPEALARAHEARAKLDTAAELAKVQVPLSYAVVTLGALTALLGASALVAIAMAGRVARRSRDDLLRVFSHGRALLPFVLVGHVCLLVTTLAGVLVFEATSFWHMGKLSEGEVRLMIFAILGALCMLYVGWQSLRRLPLMLSMFKMEPREVLGRVVTRAQAPELWTYVESLAAKLGALVPDHIVVGLVSGFYVTSSPMQVQPTGEALQGRTLYVPLVMLGLLDRDEVGAIIGHELAHFVGADTEYGIRFVPIYDGTVRSLVTLEERMAVDAVERWVMRPAFLLGEFFLERFDHAVNEWQRLRETEADAAGASLVGNAAAASALVRTTAVSPLIEEWLDEVIESPQDAPADLVEQLLQQVARASLTVPPEALAEGLPHPTDSHPPTRARIDATGISVHEAVLTGTRPLVMDQGLAAIDRFIVDSQTLRRQLTTDLLGSIHADQAEMVGLLQQHATAVEAETLICEGARKLGILMLVLGVPLALLGLNMMAGAAGVDADSSLMWVGVGLLVCALLLAARGVQLMRNVGKPVMLLTPTHFEFVNGTAPLPITAIANVHVIVAYGVNIYIELDPETPAPVLATRRFGTPGAIWRKRKHTIQVRLAQARVKGRALKPAELVGLIDEYMMAGFARKALEDPRHQAYLTRDDA